MQSKLFIEDRYKTILPKKINLSNNGVGINIWEINQTISELSYLTHNYFRYYGKFPSTLASQLIEDYPPPKDGILLDNFAGSGTSLLEAARRNIPSVGLDINPLAVLSGIVKTTSYDIVRIKEILKEIKCLQNDKQYKVKDIEVPKIEFLNKWFFPETVQELYKLKSILLEMDDIRNIKFFILAFLGIIRRVSKAYDGEVRPHINKDKKIRSPFEAFNKKVTEMIEIQTEFQDSCPNIFPARTFIANSTLDFSKLLPKGSYWLAISHPPYLNCFDYIPVFSLELNWSIGFDEIWNSTSLEEVKAMELKSWPANSDNVEQYYNGLKKVYENTFHVQPKNGKCAIVIGDCTIKGKLESVHKKLIPIVESIGYKLKEINYRTTHYSTGKYSYQHRADYHGEEAEKKDAIMIFEK